jgi:hypothetical protein
MNAKFGKIIRIVAIILLGLTTAMNLLGGAGTVCAAFLTKQYPPMWALYEYRWLYQALMILTILLGIAGIWAVMQLIKRNEKAFKNALILLAIGTLLGGIHMGASLILRGKAVPANMKFYINLLTLIIFLILKLPGIWNKINFTNPPDSGESSLSGGLTAFLSGLVTLSVFYWAAPSHTYLGVNWVELFDLTILICGSLLTVGGLGLLVYWFITFEASRFRSAIQTLR